MHQPTQPHMTQQYIPIGLSLSLSPINSFLLITALLALLVAILLYVYQGKLIYMPQLPPGSRNEVWLPSKFGYGPGLIKFSRKKCCSEQDDHKDDDAHERNGSEEMAVDTSNFAWEEVELVTPDNEKLQAYWLKAPSTTTDTDIGTDTGSVPFTVLYMPANAGNIVRIVIVIVSAVLDITILYRLVSLSLYLSRAIDCRSLENYRKLSIVMSCSFLIAVTANPAGHQANQGSKLILK